MIDFELPHEIKLEPERLCARIIHGTNDSIPRDQLSEIYHNGRNMHSYSSSSFDTGRLQSIGISLLAFGLHCQYACTGTARKWKLPWEPNLI